MKMLPRIGVAEAASRFWDVIVIGAGPAGAVAARQLAGAGLQTLLVERSPFPRTKVCGGCLNGRAIALLEHAGLSGVLRASNAVPVHRFVMGYNGLTISLPLSGGAALSREAFDAALVHTALDGGACFLPETRAALMPSQCDPDHRHEDRRWLRLATTEGTHVAAARVVIAADGLGHPSLPAEEFVSRVSSHARIGLSATFRDEAPDYPTNVIHMAVGRRGYVGLVRLHDGRLNVAAAVDGGFVKRSGGAAASVREVLQEAGFSAPAGLLHASWHGTVQLTQHALRPAGRRVLLLGDAASYIEPFTGEGIAWAIATGLAAPSVAVNGLVNWNDRLEREWISLYECLVRRRQGLCQTIARLLRCPRMLYGAMRLLAWFPSLAGPVVRRLNLTELPARGQTTLARNAS